MRLADLLDPNAPEDDIVAGIELPWYFERGLKALVGFVIAFAVVATLVENDGDDRFNLALAALLAGPWLLWLVRCGVSEIEGAAWVLGPAAVVVAVDWVNGDRSLGAAPQILLYLCLLMLVGCVFAPRRMVTLVVVATFVVFLVRGFTPHAEAWLGVTWLVALSFCVTGTVGIRVGALHIARVQTAQSEADALDERRQIARDIHDVVAHTLAVTMLHVTAARMAVERAAIDDAVDALEEAEVHGRASLGDIRRTIRLLRSDGETPLDAAQPDVADLPDLVDRYRAAGLPVTLSVRGETDRASATAGLAIYRVVQEALANAARHGNGETVVRLDVADGEVALHVANPVKRAARADGHGTGLEGMSERIMAAGGAFVAGAQNGTWVVDARLPIARATG